MNLKIYLTQNLKNPFLNIYKKENKKLVSTKKFESKSCSLINYKIEIYNDNLELNENNFIKYLYEFLKTKNNKIIDLFIKNKFWIYYYKDKFGNSLIHYLLFLSDIYYNEIQILLNKLNDIKILDTNYYNINIINYLFFDNNEIKKKIFYNWIIKIYKNKLNQIFRNYNNLSDENYCITYKIFKKYFKIIKIYNNNSYSIIKFNKKIIFNFNKNINYQIILSENEYLFIDLKNKKYFDLIKDFEINNLFFFNFIYKEGKYFEKINNYQIIEEIKNENKLKIIYEKEIEYKNYKIFDFNYSNYKEFKNFYKINSHFKFNNYIKYKDKQIIKVYYNNNSDNLNSENLFFYNKNSKIKLFLKKNKKKFPYKIVLNKKIIKINYNNIKNYNLNFDKNCFYLENFIEYNKKFNKIFSIFYSLF